MNLSVVDHYTVHYSRVGIVVGGGGGERHRNSNFPGECLSAVVSGLQEGQQYQFSVSFTISR